MRMLLSEYRGSKIRKRACVFLCVAVFLLVLSGSTEAATPGHILFLHAQSEEFPAHKLFESGFKNQMQRAGETKVEYSYAYLELTKFSSDPRYPERLASFLKQKYAGKPPDLVVTHLGPAADFALKYGREVFPGAQFILSTDEVEGVSDHKLPPGFGGVTGTFNVQETVRLILKLQPNVRKIYVVLGSSEREQQTLAFFRRDVAALSEQVEFVYLNDRPLAQMVETVGQVRENAAVIYIFVFKDVAGNVFVPANEVKTFSMAANVPVYVSYSIFMGKGTIGGYVMSVEVLGMKAAELGLSRLLAQDGPSAPVMVQSAEYQFDWRELKRWGIEESTLPAGSKVLYKELTVWEQYRGYIIGAALLIILQALLAGGLLINRSRRLKAEQELMQMNAALERKVYDRTIVLSNINDELEQENDERRRAETALCESEERYRAMMHQSSDAISLVDPETKQFIEVNDRWLQMFGYAAEEVADLSVYDLIDDNPEKIDRGYEEILRTAETVTVIRRVRRKDGRIIEVERSATFIEYGGKKILLFANRDISTERKLQEHILKDVRLAADVQKTLLPQGFDDVLLAVRIIFKPYRMVSGDFYDFAWSPDHQRFSGFILDVSGHGVSSSLQGIAVSTYFRDVLDSPMDLEAKLKWINQRVLRYFTDETYAAAIYFEFDFTRRTLRFATAGIYGLLASSAALPSVVKKEGSLIGIAASPEYTEWTVPIQPGDAFYFMTDGLFEQVSELPDLQTADFEETVSWLRAHTEGPGTWDDCCALCIRVNRETTFPFRFDFHRFSEYSRIRRRLYDLVKKLGGEQAGKIGIAVGEALNNATRESMDVGVKVNRIGARLVIRVKDGGNGFDGNSRVAAFSTVENEDSFEERLYAEGGRGILIMVSWMDRVIYNRKGNEVLLMKRRV